MPEATRTLERLELIGGALCLDFANTINSRLDPEHDYLMRYSDLVEWGEKVGLLSPRQVRQLRQRAKRNLEEAAAVLDEARRLRELLYRIFSKAVQGSESNQKDLEMFVNTYANAVSHGRLVKEGKHYRTTWNLDERVEGVLWPIVYAAGDLLHSEELRHVKECPGCGWLFLDTSKNQSRRWCSMDTCGARDKMRRYHKRQRAK